MEVLPLPCSRPRWMAAGLQLTDFRVKVNLRLAVRSSYLASGRIARETSHSIALVLLHAYTLPRTRVYRAFTWQRTIFQTVCHSIVVDFGRSIPHFGGKYSLHVVSFCASLYTHIDSVTIRIGLHISLNFFKYSIYYIGLHSERCL
jgi:hypothetical protein